MTAQQKLKAEANDGPDAADIARLKALQRAGEFAALEAQARPLADKYPSALTLFNFLGLAQVSQGKLAEANESFTRAVELAPNEPQLQATLARTLMATGRIEEGCARHLEAIRLDPANAHYLLLAASDMCNIRETAVSPNLTSLLKVLLDCREMDQAPLRRLAVAVTNFVLAANEMPKGTGPDALLAAQEFSGGVLAAYLNAYAVNNTTIEEFLVQARGELLRGRKTGLPESEKLDLLIGALATQCFLNEFVWFISEQEYELAGALEAEICDTLESGGAPKSGDLLLLACYRPLLSIAAVRDWAVARAQDDTPFSYHLRRLVLDPLEERELAANIRRLTRIDDDVSLGVQSQYEENPYPRWSRIAPKSLYPYTSCIANLIAPNKAEIVATSDAPRVLVAGCGTGFHPIWLARSFENCTVLAVDLSTASLAYATRMARELNVTNIEFAQADILRLDEIDEQFDVVESSGVIHHMADPAAGLKALVGRLKPGGYIKLGLYAEQARPDIMELRRKDESRELDLSPKGMRDYRQQLKEIEPELYQRLSLWNDLFSLSMLRDLVFHVQEHCYTIPKLRALIEENDLEFLGFFFNTRPEKNLYRATYPGDPDCTNLDNWAALEATHPALFRAMYQFWCRKPV